MPRKIRRQGGFARRRAQYGGIADLTYDYNTGWFYPKDVVSSGKYGKWGDRTWGQFLYDISPLGFVMPRAGENKESYEGMVDGYMPYKPGVMSHFPDPLKLSKSASRIFGAKKNAKPIVLPRL